MARKYRSFREFYPFYLSEHSDKISRRLHFAGTSLFILLLLAACITSMWWLLILCPVAGYGFAWTGHFFFEKNHPATFTYPLWSLASDFRLFFSILSGKQKL